MSAAFPPLGWWPLAFVGVAPFLWLLRSAGGARGAVLGFVFGLGCYGATFYWIGRFGEMAWVAITLLCAGSAVVFGLFAPAVQRRGRPLLTAVGLASLWTVTDWVRTAWPLGGFSWGSLGVSQVDDRAVLRLATITGVWGVTFVVLAVNALLVEAAVGGGGVGRRAGRLLVAACLILAPLLIPFSVPDGSDVDVATLQVDVRQAARDSSVGEDEAVARLHIALHAQLAGRSARPRRLGRGRARSGGGQRRRDGRRRGGRDRRRRLPDARRCGARRRRRHAAHERGVAER